MTDSGSRHAAFISYSHSDEEIARWFHRRLESYRIPKAYAGRAGPTGQIGARIGKVFRDREEFAAGGELKAEIEAALDRSDVLIVLCSPAAAASRYVNAEVEYFKAHGGRRIIPVILSGEFPSCQPPALQDGVDRLSADFREGRDGRDAGALKVISGLLGVGLDDLVQRDAVARRWRMRATIGVVALLAVLGILSSTFGTLAYQNVMRAREIHAARLLEETNFLVDEALAARERGDTTAAVERALQALPVDFENPERPFSMRALAALQGAIFDSTMIARATATETPIVGMALIESQNMAFAATADGQLLRYDVDNFGEASPAGQCPGAAQDLRTLDATQVIVLRTDRAVCGWTYAGSRLSALPTLNQSGEVTLQNDRIIVSGSTLSIYDLNRGAWHSIDVRNIATPSTARPYGAGMLAFDHGTHFHLIDAYTRQNLRIGCLGGPECPSSVFNYQSIAANADRTRFAFYGQGESYIDFAHSYDCTTEGAEYYGGCQGGARRIPTRGENTVRIEFATGSYPTYVRDEFTRGFEVGNSTSGSFYYPVSGRARTERALSRDGRFLAVYEPGERTQDGGEIIELHDLLSPEGFGGLAIGGRVKSVELGQTGRLAMVLERDGRLTLHNRAGRTAMQERRWSTSSGEAPYTYFKADEALGLVFPSRVRVISANDLNEERVVELNGGVFQSAEFRDLNTGCILTAAELICVLNGDEHRTRLRSSNAQLTALSDDGARVAMLGAGQLAVYATDGSGLLWSFPAPSEDFCCVHFSASNATLLVSYQSGTWVGYDAANGTRRYSVGARGGPHSRVAINRARTRFLARVRGESYAIFDINTGETVQSLTIPGVAANDEWLDQDHQEIAIDQSFAQIWYVARAGQGVIRSLRDGTERTIDIESQTLGDALANFSPSGQYVVRESRHRYTGGTMGMPEAMQIVDLERGIAAGREAGGWSPVVGGGLLDTDAMFARSYSLGLQTLYTPPMDGGTEAMRVEMGNPRRHARLALLGLRDARPFGAQSVEFSLDMYSLDMSRSQQRLLMTAVDNASGEFVVRSYRVLRRCSDLRADGEALLGRRPSPPSALNDAGTRLGWLENLFSVLLGRQRFAPGACET